MNVAAILKTKGHEIVTVNQDATLEMVAGTLAENRIGAVVVLGTRGDVAGIISERDIVRMIARDGASALLQSAGSAMTRDVATCGPGDTLDDVMELMTNGRFRHAPVIESDKLVGIISIGDVVKHHIAEVELEASALKTYLVAG
ncbi:MAG: CBS domain-containing protein [Hyphomicrobiaceae bacterium]